MKTTKKSMTMKIVSIMLSIIMIAGILPIAVFATEPAQEMAYISASHDGQFIDDADGNPMAYVGVALDDLTAIDLDTYGLSDYKYDKDGDGNYEITLLHLYIYVHEMICGGDWSEVEISGGAGSIYFAGGLFGFEDENLRYNYNGAYPAVDGWGLTADQIVLSDGDFIEVAHYTDWYFYGDSAYGFHYFTNENDEIHISYSAETGTALPLKLIRVGGGMGMGDTTTAEAGYTVYYGSSIGNVTGSVTTDDAGVASITFSDPGTYYVWCDGGEGIDQAAGAIVSSPASATVTVTGESTGAGSGSGEGSGDSGEGSGDSDETEVPDGKTSLKVTADEGITLTADARYYCNEDCEGEKSDIATSKVTSIDTSVNWSCSAHNTTSNTPYYMMSVNAFYAENYIITGITVNGTKYVVDMTDEDYSITYLDDYSYIAENTNCISIAIAAEAELVDQVIHIHAEAKRVAQDVSEVLDATLAQLAATVTEPAFGTSAGEWTVLSLARGGYFAKDNVYFTDYYNRIVATVNETAASVNMNGALHKNKSTENSRLIVALSAIGKDATAVGDWNLVEAYSANGFTWIKKQGINGSIWALIALDSNNYETSDTTIRQQCVDAIVAAQHNDGGWSLMANKAYASDPDVTGMALQALYPYRDQPAVAEACAEAFECLSAMQHENGTFASWNSECSESCAWVIVSCTTWGINPDTDSRFIKNGNSVVDGLLAHYLEDVAQFQHIIGAGANGMATDQSCYALVAYDRLLNEQPALFDYSDVTFEHIHSEETVSGYAATCTEAGLTDGKKCSVCGEITVAQTEIPAPGHVDETVSGYAATCTETGLTDGKKCSVCGETLVAQIEIAALGHVDNDNDNACDTCGTVLKVEEEIPEEPEEPEKNEEENSVSTSQAIRDTVDFIIKKATESATEAVHNAVSNVREAANRVRTAAEDAVKNITETFESIHANVTEFFGGIKEKLEEVFSF